MKKLWLSIALATAVLLLFAITTTQAQSGVGTLSYVQENGRRVEGLVSVGGYSVTVTLKDPDGVVKAEQMVWPDAGLRYQVNLTATIAGGDTVEVTAGGTTTAIFVEPMTGQVDPMNDRIMGTGPTGQSLGVELWSLDQWGMYTTFTATVEVDTTGLFTVSTFYQNGVTQTVDIQPGDYGTLRYTHADANQVYRNIGGQAVLVHQNYNYVYGYAGLQSVPVSVTLYAPGGGVKAACSTTSDSGGSGGYQVYFYSEGCMSYPWEWGDPVIIRGGDIVVIAVEGVSTTVAVPLLTATPNLGTDTVSGVGPPNSMIKVTLHSCYDYATSQGCRVWSATDNAGVYSAGPFLYRDTNWITRTYDIKAGDTGQVHYTNPDFNSIFINYAATGVATTIAGGGVRAGATAVMGTAVPGVTVEIWDVTENALIGTGVAGADARFAINVSPPLIYGHTIVAIANGLPSIGHIVQRAITINGPTTSITNTIGLYGIAPANATVVIYLQGSLALPIKTVQAGPNGYWNTTVSLPTGTSSLYALVQGTEQESDVITIIVDSTAVAIGGSTGSTPGDTYQSDPSGQNHFPIFGSVQPLTITVEILNNPCTVTLSFMGQTVTATAGTTPDPRTNYTVVFTDYTWEWGTHEVNVNAISCGGTAVSQKVAEVTLIDPSGYVYDALTGEKIQGATATCYYSKTIVGEWVVWEAALYNNQINPQLTDATGWYGFMVPEGYYYVTASAPGYEDNQTIVYYIPPEVTDAHIPLTPIAGYPATVTLTVVPTTIPVGGADSLLTAVVVDRYGSPVDDGTVVTFTSTLGSVDGGASAPRTTVGGIATATLTSGATSGVATVIAETEGGSDTANVSFAPGAPFTVTLAAHPTMLPINGATAWLTATVIDEFGNPVADGSIITFTTDLGTLNPGNTTSLPIPTVNGIALATFATEAVTGTATVTATAGAGWDTVEIIIYAPVIASFTANPTEGVAPLAVTFTNQSTGDYATQTWNFGDSGTSVAQHPVYTYTTAGVFTVTLTVGGPGGSDTLTRTSYITVTEPSIPAPEVDFVGAPRSGDTPLTVQFTSTVTNTVTSYAWTFGDGGTAATANPTHTYQTAGSYGVSLIVTGPGGTAQAVKSGYITVNPPSSVPTATFSADVVTGTAPLNVTFTAVTSGTVEGWLWDFGDGGMSTTGPVVQYTYTTPGSFDVRLTVSNTSGSYIVGEPRYITITAPPNEHYYIYLPLVMRAH